MYSYRERNRVSKRIEYHGDGEGTRRESRKLIRNFRNILTEMGVVVVRN